MNPVEPSTATLPSRFGTCLALLCVAFALTATVDLLTNESPVGEFADPYASIALDGIANNPRLVSPVAYRFVSPWMAGWAARTFHVDIPGGFRIVNYVASVCLLLLVYGFTRQVGAPRLGAWTAVFVVGLSIGHIKNNLFFNNGMESVTQSFMLIFLMLYLSGWRWAASAVVALGLCTREFFLLPAAILVTGELLAWRRAGSASAAGRAACFLGLALAAFALPRWLIPVADTIQLVDPLYDTNWLKKALSVPLNMKRNLNVAISVIGYLLPTLMLVTRARWATMRAGLIRHRWMLLVYCTAFFAMFMYSGTDLYRYATYLLLPQLICIAFAFQSPDRVGAVEAAFVAAAVAYCNNIAATIPDFVREPKTYLDFWPAFEDVLTWSTVRHLVEWAACILACNAFRRLAAWYNSPAPDAWTAPNLIGESA